MDTAQNRKAVGRKEHSGVCIVSKWKQTYVALLKAVMSAGLRAAEKYRCKPVYTARDNWPCRLEWLQALMRGRSNAKRALLIVILDVGLHAAETQQKQSQPCA